MISIIIPVYNVEKYLPQCLDSILSQTYKDFEVILVDDGSPDNSGKICDEYASKDSRVRVIHQENAGVSVSRNIGIEKAEGEWITFIDSDDFVESDYLEHFELDIDDADLIVQGLEYYDSRNGKNFKKVKVKNCTLSEDTFMNDVTNNNLLGSGYPVAKAFKRNLLSSDVRFNTAISFHEDHIFVLDAMYAAKKIRLADSVAYKYRYYHSSNTLSTKRHPWANLNKAADGMLACLDRMKHRFWENESEYSHTILSFAYHPKISAVFEMIRTVNKYSERKQHYRTIINIKQLKELYRPIGSKDKLIKTILVYAPYFAKDVFLHAIIKYQNRNK